MALPIYSTGTVSVAAGGTVVTGVGGAWTGTNVKQGDFISIAGSTAVLVTEVTDTTHLMIAPWPGAAQAGAAYSIYQNYVGRVVGVAAAEDVGVMLEKLHVDGLPFIVGPTEAAPDPSYGDDGQLAFKPTTGEWWTKTGGVWVPSTGIGGSAATIDYDTRAAVAAANVPVSFSYVRTAGYSAAGDTGGGLYARVGSAPAHPGKVQSADGAWWELRVESHVLAEQLGAKGDGATNDLTALNDAVLYCAATLATLRLGPNEYRINNTLEITSSIRIEGASMMMSRITSNALGNDAIRIHANGGAITGPEITNLSINYTAKASAGSYAIRLKSTSSGLVYYCYLNNLCINANAFGGVSVECGFWHVLHKIYVLSVGANGIGFNFQGTSASALTGNIFMSNCAAMQGTASTSTAGMVVDSWAEGLYIENCTLETPGLNYGLWIRNTKGASYSPRNLFFDTMVCDANQTCGLIIDAALQVNFANCWFTSAQTSVGIQMTQASSITFTSCQIISNWHNGAAWTTTASQITFNGCVFDNNGQAGVGTMDAIYLAAGVSDFMITNCTFYRGIGTTKTHRYSVTVAAGSSNRYIISHNNLFGYLTGALSDGGSGVNKVVSGNIT